MIIFFRSKIEVLNSELKEMRTRYNQLQEKVIQGMKIFLQKINSTYENLKGSDISRDDLIETKSEDYQGNLCPKFLEL